MVILYGAVERVGVRMLRWFIAEEPQQKKIYHKNVFIKFMNFIMHGFLHLAWVSLGAGSLTITTSFSHPKQHHSGGKNEFCFSCMFLNEEYYFCGYSNLPVALGNMGARRALPTIIEG
ncbi:unnamed protein product, partial [Nesidiocoris tenuis]